jgi:hypothetical protein
MCRSKISWVMMPKPHNNLIMKLEKEHILCQRVWWTVAAMRLCSDQEIRVETFEMRKVDRVGADRVGLCKLLRAVATTACHTLIPSSPHLRPAFDQQDLSFIIPHTRLFSCLVAVFLTHPVPIRHPYYPENHRPSIPIPRGPDYSILPINIPFSPQILHYIYTQLCPGKVRLPQIPSAHHKLDMCDPFTQAVVSTDCPSVWTILLYLHHLV